jgi:hypothetical protein
MCSVASSISRASAESSEPALPALPTSGNRLAAMVPPGMTNRDACADFASVMECATALHAAQNLQLPFMELKSRVAGGQNLAAAIYQLKPDADATAEVLKAQAKSDLSVHR